MQGPQQKGPDAGPGLRKVLDQPHFNVITVPQIYKELQTSVHFSNYDEAMYYRRSICPGDPSSVDLFEWFEGLRTTADFKALWGNNVSDFCLPAAAADVLPCP